jgi:PAS domain S-box-containing protein
MLKRAINLIKRNRLRLKLLASVVGVVLLFLSISTYFSVRQTGEIILDQLDVYGNSMARSLANFSIEDLLAWDYPRMQAALGHIGEYDSQIVEIEIIHNDRVVALYRSDEYPEGIAKNPDEAGPQKILVCECLKFEHPVTYHVSATNETKELGKVRITLSKKKYDLFLAQQIRLLLYLSLVLLVGDTILSYLTVKLLVLNPINRVKEGAEIIGQGKLSHRIDTSREDEIGKVAETINKMAKNLKQSRDEAEDYKKHLEKKVKDRTRALKELAEKLEDKVSERTRQLEEEKNKTRETLVSLPAGLVVFDQEEKISLVNPAAEAILNIKESQVLNKKISQITDCAYLQKLYLVLGNRIKWTRKKYELVLEQPLKRYFQVSLSKVVVGKEIAGITVILHDITKEKEIERMKNEFISISAHQLRTPSSAVKWTLNMILEGEMGKISKEAREYIERAKDTNDRMIALVNDLLNISRIEEGRFIYEKELMPIGEIVEEVAYSSAVLAADKGVKVKIGISKDLPKIKMDLDKMKIALQNLIDNAIRYSEKGGEVNVDAKLVKEKKEEFIQISVSDRGIGILEKDKACLFSKFHRGENAVRTQTEGSGLGLFIAKNIINAHGGKIWAESAPGKGSVFYVVIPLKINRKKYEKRKSLNS